MKRRGGGEFTCKGFGNCGFKKTHFLSSCRTCQSLYHEGGHCNCPRGGESISKLTFVAHLPIAPRIVNLGIAGIDDGGPWRGFKAGAGMVRREGVTRMAGKATGENKRQELDVEALLNSRPFQPGCLWTPSRGWPAAHPLAPTHSGSTGEAAEPTPTALSKQSRVASVQNNGLAFQGSLMAVAYRPGHQLNSNPISLQSILCLGRSFLRGANLADEAGRWISQSAEV